MMMNYDIPILIIAFNRPEVSRKTFAQIRQFHPAYLYVAIYGARKQVPGEEELVSQVSAVYHDIDWECDAHYKISDINKGAEITVSSAISWVLSQHEYCIILEDDVLVTESFLRFAGSMLKRYAGDERIYVVSAAQFTPMKEMKTDYVFSIYGHTGFGWATWRRAWQHFTFDLNDFNDTLSDSKVARQFSTHQAFSAFRKSVKRMQKTGSRNCSWDRCWSYIRLRDGGLSIVPKFNLTQNIGVFGFHAQGVQGYHKMTSKEGFQVLTHPEKIEIDHNYDKYHYEHYLYHSFTSRAKAKIRILFQKLKN